MAEFTPSQHIESKDIDDEYDKLHAVFEIARKALLDIAHTPHGIEGFDSSHDAAMWMNDRANKALAELA